MHAVFVYKVHMHIYTFWVTRRSLDTNYIFLFNSREKWRKCISVTGSLRDQVQVRPIDKLDEARTNADDQMMLVQHYSGDRVMSYRGFDRIS